jgi:hypothetical protein
LYVADFQHHRIRHITSDEVTTVAGGHEAGRVDGYSIEARFNNPYGIVLVPSPLPLSSPTSPITVTPSPILYVADQGNHSIRKITFTTARAWKVDPSSPLASVSSSKSLASGGGPEESNKDWAKFDD